MTENERFGLVLVKTGSINSGTGNFKSSKNQKYTQCSFDVWLMVAQHGKICCYRKCAQIKTDANKMRPSGTKYCASGGCGSESTSIF